MKNKLAFTLIELLIVLVILSVIAGLSIPNFSKNFGHFELKKTAEDIVYLVRWAQLRAVNDKVNYQLVFFNDPQSYRILRAETSNRVNTSDFIPLASHMGRIFKIPDSVKVKNDVKSLMIHPDGTLDKVRIHLTGQGGGLILSSLEQRGNLFIIEDSDES